MSSWWWVFTFYGEGLDSLKLSKRGAYAEIMSTKIMKIYFFSKILIFEILLKIIMKIITKR